MKPSGTVGSRLTVILANRVISVPRNSLSNCRNEGSCVPCDEAEIGKAEADLRNVTQILTKEGPNSPRYQTLMSTLDAILAKKKELEAKLIPVEDEIKDLETRNIDSEVLRRQLGNFLAVLKDVAFDGQTKWVQTNLRPLPKVWGDLTVLEGMLVPLKLATQPGGFAGPCGVSQGPSATLRADGSACRVAG